MPIAPGPEPEEQRDVILVLPAARRDHRGGEQLVGSLVLREADVPRDAKDGVARLEMEIALDRADAMDHLGRIRHVLTPPKPRELLAAISIGTSSAWLATMLMASHWGSSRSRLIVGAMKPCSIINSV